MHLFSYKWFFLKFISLSCEIGSPNIFFISELCIIKKCKRKIFLLFIDFTRYNFTSLRGN